MASTPLRPYDKRELNVGTRTGPPGEPAFAGDDFLAGTTYVSDCNGGTSKNGSKPGFGGTPLGVFEEPDGTIKRYFAYGDETIIDSYCRNDGITQSKYDALSDENKKNYCDDPIGGKYYLTSPNCGYVREVSRPVGVDIWYPLPDNPDGGGEDQSQCTASGDLIARVSVTGSTSGTVYGNGPYTSSSDIATAAVHAGLLELGQAGVIQVFSASTDIISNFPGSTQNGVTSLPFSSTRNGGIAKLEITNAGTLASTDTNISPVSGNNGKDASIRVNVVGNRILSVSIDGPGFDYKVGDQFEVTSLGFGPSAETPGILTVTEVKTVNLQGECGVDLILESAETKGEPECEPEIITKGLTVDFVDTQSRGPILAFEGINPKPNSLLVNGTPNTGDNYNWYYSCPADSPTNGPNLQYTNRYNMYQIGGPSFGEEGKADFTYSYRWNNYTGSNITKGCATAEESGVITGVKILNPGQRNTNSPTVRDGTPNNGEGASFNVTYDSEGTVTRITIANGGDGYQIGDKFRITSTFVFNYPEPAEFEVTQIDVTTQPGFLNWYIEKMDISNNNFKGGDGYAVGDIFEFRIQDDEYDTDTLAKDNVNAKFRVIAIDAQELSGESTLNYEVEKNVRLTYTNFAKDREVDYVIGVDPDSTTDEKLAYSGESVMAMFFGNIARFPTDIEFQYWTKKLYQIGGDPTDDYLNDFRVAFDSEINPSDQVVSIIGECDRILGENDPDPQGPTNLNVPTDVTDCRWDRATFYQPLSQVGARGPRTSLKRVWDFLGQPKGGSGQGGSANPDEIPCPRPENDAGMIQDDEPDLSDFAGMRLWRWLPCTDGSNNGDADIGGYEEIIVPCVTTVTDCTNPETEDQYALYDQDVIYTYNDGFLKFGNYAKEPKTSDAITVNNKYLELFGRPTEQEGYEYWLGDINARRDEDQDAIYYVDGRIKYNDGFEKTDNFVESAKNTISQAINAKYQEVLGRPAEKAGMEIWAAEARSIGLDQTLQNIELAAATELARGGVAELVVGLPRTLEHIEYAASVELARGGIASISYYCDRLTQGNISLEYFYDTRLPPAYGTLTLGNPNIIGLSTNDNIYIVNSPQTQTEEYAGFKNDTGTESKVGFVNAWNIAWPELEGELQEGEAPPVIAKRVECTAYDYQTGIELESFKLQDYTNDVLETNSVNAGPRDYSNFGTEGSGGYTQPWGGDLGIDFDGSANYNSYSPEFYAAADQATEWTFRNQLVYMPFFDSAYGTIGINEAEALSYNVDPITDRRFYWEVKATMYCLDPQTNEPIPGLTKSAITKVTTPGGSNRMFKAWGSGPGPGCDEKTCPDGSTVCVDENCPSGPGNCNNLSISCGGDNQIDVETNENTTIRFSYRVNNASSCSTKGSAKVSIRRYWPCPIFGPAAPSANEWIVQKRSVSIVDGEAAYELKVNTSKDDYLATSSGDQTVDNPGNCHWVYVAYWEINGMESTSISCKNNLWDNPGCDYGRGRNQLAEILCVQQQNCTDDPGAGTSCENNTDIPDSDFDFERCLPYCYTSGGPYFYWYYIMPSPGVNCSDGSDGPTQSSCDADCPVCEQTIKVVVGDTTECGPLSKPGMIEGGGPGINSAAFTIGNSEIINVPNTFATKIPLDKVTINTDQNTQLKWVKFDAQAWVYLARKTIDGVYTKGVDNAVDFSGNEEDYDRLYNECCPGNMTTFECQGFVKSGKCGEYEDGTLQSGVLVDCDAKVRVVAKFWYQPTFVDGTTPSGPLFPLTKFNNENGTLVPEQLVPDDYFQPAAGNSENAFILEYFGEEGTTSFFLGDFTTAIPYDKVQVSDKKIRDMSIYCQIIASNDHFYVPGNDPGKEYHPPPAGFNEGDFGTDNTVSSPRPPWNIGTQGPGPKDTIFFVGKYSIGEETNLPTVDWTAVMEGCEDAQIYDQWTSQDELFCGEPGQPGSYSCKISGIGQYQESWTNYDGTTGGSIVFGCNPWKNAPDQSCVPPRTDAQFSINTSDGSGIFDFDYGDETFPYGCDRGLRVLWYVNGRLRSNGDIVDQGTGTGGLYDVSNALSCGNRSFNGNTWMTDAETEYTVEAIIVMSNIPPTLSPTPKVPHTYVNFDYSTANGDPFNYFDVSEWALKRGTSLYPTEITRRPDGSPLVEGDLWQVVLGSAVCTVKGNDGSTGDKDLTGLQTPDFVIQQTGGGQGDAQDDFCSQSPCCDPGYASDPSNRCTEILAALQSVCGDRLCVGAGSGSLILTAVVNNRSSAWPYIPGTQEQVVGTIKYFWEERGNDSVWRAVSGGTGESITGIQDGRTYRCTVTFDLTGRVPNGYTAKPISTEATKQYTVTNSPTQTCPDGTVIPIDQECPTDTSCIPPQYLSTSTSPFYINNQGAKTQQITVNNGQSIKLDVFVPWQGMSQTGWVYNKAEAWIYNGIPSPGNVLKTLTLTPSSNPNLKNQDIISFSGSTTDSASNTTKNYSIMFRLYFTCQGESQTFEAYSLVNHVRATWGSTEQPYVYAGPECRFASAYTNSSGCGSYVADWYDPQTQTIGTYYMLKKDSVDIADRGPKWSSAISQQNASCTFCPSGNCPTLKITGVTLNPANPKIGERVTAMVNFVWDPKGFQTTPNTLAQWTGDGVPCQSGQAVCLQEGVSVFLGPYTSNGIKNLTVSVTKFFEDLQEQCPISEDFNLYGFQIDSYDFTINIGGTNEPPDDSVKPTVTASISTDTSPVYVGNEITFEVDYTISDGKGYTPAERDVSMKWDGGTAKFNQVTYNRTFNSAGDYTVTCRVAKLYAKPGYDGPLDARSILDAGEEFWAYTDVSYNVKAVAEPSNDVAPSATASITGPSKGTLNNGTVTLNFSATASIGATNYSPTAEPSRFTYGRNNAYKNNTTNVSWSETFTSAGTYTIPVTFRKNYCDPGVGYNTSTGSCDTGSKTSAVGRASKTVVIEAGGPTGTKPTATIRQQMSYSTELNGCGYGVTGTGVAVTCTVTIDLTQGTGDYAWDDATTSTGTWTRNGNTLQQTITRFATTERDYSGTFGTTVIFKKNGQEVHRDGSGQASWCINIVTININPIIPGPGPGGFNPA